MEPQIFTLGTGTFQAQKIKAIHIKKQLIDKHRLLIQELRLREITKKNLIAKRIVRMGLIAGAVTYENNEIRIKRSYKSPITIKTSHDDIIYNDAKWKTKRIIKRKKLKNKINLKQTYANLRKAFMMIIKSRSSSLISFITNIDEYLIKNIMYVSTNTYRHAETTANAAVRKIQRKYSLASTFFPTIRERKKALSGFFIFWRGRYKKTAKVKETSFERGTMPYSSVNASLAIASQKIRTTYGIANCNINLHWTQRTISDSLRKYKKKNYVFSLRPQNAASQTKNTLRFFSQITKINIKNNKVKLFEYALKIELDQRNHITHNLNTKIFEKLKKKLKQKIHVKKSLKNKFLTRKAPKAKKIKKSKISFVKMKVPKKRLLKKTLLNNKFNIKQRLLKSLKKTKLKKLSKKSDSDGKINIKNGLKKHRIYINKKAQNKLFF